MESGLEEEVQDEIRIGKRKHVLNDEGCIGLGLVGIIAGAISAVIAYGRGDEHLRSDKDEKFNGCSYCKHGPVMGFSEECKTCPKRKPFYGCY